MAEQFLENGGFVNSVKKKTGDNRRQRGEKKAGNQRGNKQKNYRLITVIQTTCIELQEVEGAMVTKKVK